LALSAKELEELNREEISPEALAELNDEAPTSDVGPFASGYKLPPPKIGVDPAFRDDVATQMSRSALEAQRLGDGGREGQRRGGGELARAVSSRMVHNASAGYSDEAAGVPGGILGAIRATSANMGADPNAQFDEFGIQVGGPAAMAAAGGYQKDRDADRAEQADLAERHKTATALVDVGSAFAPGGTARLAAQGLGDSEATTAVGLGKDTAKGLGAAAATKLLGWGAGKAAGKVGKAAADKAAPEVEEAPTLVQKAKAAMTPETLRNVRAEQEIQGAVRVNGRKLGEVGVTRVNGAPLGAVPTAPGGPVPVAPVGVPVGPRVPAPTTPKGPGLGASLRDLAAASVADYAVAKVAKELDLPYGGPLITAVVAAKKASAKATAGGAVVDLVAKAHEAGLDTAAARLIAEQLPKAAATAFLDRFLTRDSK